MMINTEKECHGRERKGFEGQDNQEQIVAARRR